MSGLSRTPGKRVQGNTLTGVRIPPSPPNAKPPIWAVFICLRYIRLYCILSITSLIAFLQAFFYHLLRLGNLQRGHFRCGKVIYI